MGTSVTVRWDDGVEERFNILGEWDRDEALSVISNKSQVAQTIEGLAAGARFQVGDQSDRKGVVIAVGPLPEAVQHWIKGA